MLENRTGNGNIWWGLFGGGPGVLIAAAIVKKKRYN